MFTLLGSAGALGALWWALFALKPYDITPEQLAARYAHATTTAALTPAAVQLGAPQRITVGQTAAWASDLAVSSFDGAVASGRIVYPADPAVLASPRPVLLGLHAMGRSHGRWSEAEIKGKRTRENTHRLAELALQQGYVVMALDAREHGGRKNADKPLTPRELLRNLHWWGEREPYERLIVDTVKDWRVLVDWVTQQPQFDRNNIRAAGYSMGAQMALLLAGTDGRVSAVAAMVPPGLTNRVAVVAPLNVAPQLAATRVWLLTGDDDDHASVDENAALFEALPGAGKQHLRFAGGHLLPTDYVERLLPWLTEAGRSPNTTPSAALGATTAPRILAE
ncbi:MAG: acetylesterase [Leptothrix sp. (in: Bacteria)]|nr:acetylesterase [Leptothrix sp. (in: b-proteobacteria)]